MNGFELEVPIAAWSAWAPGVDTRGAWNAWTADPKLPEGESAPAVSFVDPLLRRRLGRSVRMALQVAHECLQNRGPTRAVFASRHGDLHRTVRMLGNLNQRQPPSPTDFSLSVHNTAAGIYSILRGDASPTVAVGAGEESFGYGLLEAGMQWRLDPSREVLLVYADEPAPVEYRSFVAGTEVPHALALLLSRDADTLLRLRRRPGTGVRSPEMQSWAFLQSWVTRAVHGGWRGERSAWEWDVSARAV
jgi:hypothetical protein